MHIGKLERADLRAARSRSNDLMIEGLHPSDRPFLTAKRVYV